MTAWNGAPGRAVAGASPAPAPRRRRHLREVGPHEFQVEAPALAPVARQRQHAGAGVGDRHARAAPGQFERDQAGAAAGVEHPRAHGIAERR